VRTSTTAPTTTEAVIRFEDVSVRRDERIVLEGVTFNVGAAEFVGVVGPNGAGKTTLLKAMLGLMPVSSGRIEVFGRPPGEHVRDANNIGYVPQRHVIASRFPATVADVVMMGRLSHLGPFRFPRAEDWSEVARSLELVGMTALSARPIGRLSGGEQRRVMLAQALCASTTLLVLDEPTIGLDLPAEHEFYALLRRLQAELRMTVVAVSHDLVALAGEVDELICINRRIHVHGNPDEVVHSHAVREAYSCEFDFLAGELAHHGSGSHPHPRHTRRDT
jgi:zinc transport system ATP-binding protein